MIWISNGSIFPYSSPAVIDDMLYIGTFNGLRCINTNIGGTNWEFKTNESEYFTPTIFDDKVYFASIDKNIYCLNRTTGQQIWNYLTSANASSSPAVAYNNVYVEFDNGVVYCLNAETGNLIWNKDISDYYCHSSPAVADNKVFIGSGYSVYCLNAITGDLIWEKNLKDGYVISSPSIADGKLFIGSDHGNVYCFAGLSNINLAINSITYEPNPPIKGKFVDFEVNLSVVNFEGYVIEIGFDSEFHSYTYLCGYIGTPYAVCSFPITWPNNKESYMVTITIDPDNKILENNEDDNIWNSSLSAPRNIIFDNPILRLLENNPLLFKLLQLVFRQLRLLS